MFLDLRVKIPKTQEKTQNSRKKLKPWEDFARPVRPSGVIKKPALTILWSLAFLISKKIRAGLMYMTNGPPGSPATHFGLLKSFSNDMKSLRHSEFV